MKMKLGTFSGICGVMVLAMMLLPRSHAECSGAGRAIVTPNAWHAATQPAARLRNAALTSTAMGDSDQDDPSIVGFWHVKFVAKDNTGVPDGVEVDAGYAQWHSDGTEIMNSAGRSPITGSFCLGVWKQVGERHYRLNHFASSYDPTGAHLIGPANIREDVLLDADGLKFTGTFVIAQYDESGHLLGGVKGIITGTRITVSTQAESIF